jgi:hypothetical protein
MIQWISYSQGRSSKDSEYTLCFPLIHAIGCTIQWKSNNNNATNKAFLLQKRIIRIMSSPQRSVSSRHLFKRFCILKLQSAYIISMMTFIVYKNEVSLTNSKFY